MTFFSHYVYVLRNHALAPLPLSPLEKYTWQSTALEKLEVAERRSGALRLTLTTAEDNVDDAVIMTKLL